jgi:hypothetical protein
VIAAETPPAPPAEIVVSQSAATEIVTSRDLPLTLTKAGRREDAFLRQAVFVNLSLSVVRPPQAQDAAADRFRWAYKSYLQRQVCFSSITGLFACTAAEVETLPDQEAGEAPVGAEAQLLAEAAKARITAGLKARTTALFDADRRSHADPMFRAAGVVAARAAVHP